MQFTGYGEERGPEYQLDAFTPSAAAELVSTGSLRSQRFAQLRLNPLQYNPVSGEIRYARRLLVELRFNSGQTGNSPAEGQTVNLSEGYFEDALRSQLLNYEQARGLAQPPGLRPPTRLPRHKASRLTRSP